MLIFVLSLWFTKKLREIDFEFTFEAFSKHMYFSLNKKSLISSRQAK